MATMFAEPLFIFELANNHMGDVNHGLRMIREFHKIASRFDFRFAFKFQLRTIPEFIHPHYRDRMDIKYVKRFTDTALVKEDFMTLHQEVKHLGMLSICTPFDEIAVATVASMEFDAFKIASCSFTDWPLLEEIVKYDLPIIASTAGSEITEIDNVVSFFQHRAKDFAILHCVGEYPTQDSQLQLNQIDMFKKRYPDITVGYSTHEEPDNVESIKLAVAKGSMIFEKHVAIETEAYPKNAYSSTPSQINNWLEAAAQAYAMCGVSGERHVFSEKEKSDLRQFKRGVFVKRDVKAGEIIKPEDCYFSWPKDDDQLLANDFSKYMQFTTKRDLKKDDGLLFAHLHVQNNREKVHQIVQSVNELVKQSNVPVPGWADLEISHHYGIDKFDEYGITMVTIVNRDYCKKYIIMLPGQNHPEQYHKQKEETFVILHGEFEMALDGDPRIAKRGDVITIKPGTRHAFSSASGGIIEEISTTHFVNDSYYTDPSIVENKNRKTLLSYWIL